MPGKLELFVNHQWQSYEVAADDEANILHLLQNKKSLRTFEDWLWGQKETIEWVVRHHFRLANCESCTVLTPDQWIRGGFNICIPIKLPAKTVIFRCPMPHRVGNGANKVDEKLNCEVATYMWMQEHCPEIRIPCLYAFGFTKNHFTHVSRRPAHTQIYHTLRQWCYRILRYPLLSNYVPNKTIPSVALPYMLLEYIGRDTGEMLSNTWLQHRNDSERTTRLYRGIARIMLSLAKIPQPHIGSFHFNTERCTVTLSNRPLLCSTALLESSGTEATTRSHQTYQNSDSFANDNLELFDRHLLHDPHAVRDSDDAKERMTIRFLLRATMHHFIMPEARNGPFVVQLTDLSHSNLFVDQDWNVTCLLDLEWTSALPIEMVSVPYWLTNCDIGEITDERYETFDTARQRFLLALDEEMHRASVGYHYPITQIMRYQWSNKGVWFWACLSSVNAWLFLFESHILKRFLPEEDSIANFKFLSTFCFDDGRNIIEAKVQDEKKYQAELRRLYDLPVEEIKAMYNISADFVNVLK